jgi:hypothetical protein
MPPTSTASASWSVSSECDGRWLDSRGTVWDASEPLNRIYAGSGGGPEAAARGAIAAAGPYANDLQVRCTWWPREAPEPPPPGVSLTTHLTT